MDYEKIDKDAYDILMDYGMLTFPISPIDLCHKLCIDVYKYSSFESKSALFKIKSKKGFAINRLRKIFFNDENDKCKPRVFITVHYWTRDPSHLR